MKLALKYKPRPKIAEDLFLALSMRGWMRGSVRCLKRGKLKAVLPGRFSRRMRRNRGQRIQTVMPVNNLSQQK